MTHCPPHHNNTLTHTYMNTKKTNREVMLEEECTKLKEHLTLVGDKLQRAQERSVLLEKEVFLLKRRLVDLEEVMNYRSSLPKKVCGCA